MFTKNDLIHSYTRREAIADGVLVDVSDVARKIGFVVPVAVTQSVWASCVELPPTVYGPDETGRLLALLTILAIEILESKPPFWSELRFAVCIVNDERIPNAPPEKLKAVCGPDDDGRRCLTIMCPEED